MRSIHSRVTCVFITVAAAVAPLLVVPSAGAVAQSPVDVEWNTPDAIELIRRGIERRSTEVVDTALQTYTAQGRGFVYFVLDAPELERQSLVRTDQVAVEIHWRAPNQVRQRIVGLREQRELPVTRLHYYLDRLTVVQDNYGQSIVIADGDNVNDVPHPVGIGADRFYDFRLADSLTMILPGVPDPVRVREIEVRPKDPAVPAIVGSVFLEAATGALVRMAFTFTPAAYIDPRLDFINVTLENGLWRGRYWLPHEQRLEIRREMPELDLPFGTIIRTRMRIGDYDFNQPVPEWLFASRLRVTMASREERESFPFDRPIDAEWRLEGFARPIEVAEVRRQARAVVRSRTMSGLPRHRPSIAAASDLLRYNRAEGLVLGLGWATRVRPGMDARIHGGWAFGADRPLARIEASWGERTRGAARGYLAAPRDVGGFTPASGVANTLDGLLAANDWSDPYFVSGGSVSLEVPIAQRWSARIGTRVEAQRSGELTSTFSLFGDEIGIRPVREIDEGFLASGELALRREARSAVGGWVGEARLSGGRLETDAETLLFAQPELFAGYGWSRSERRARIDVRGSGGWSFGELPRQELVLIGGRGTLPGFGHRAFGGDRYALVELLASADLAHPWLRARLFAATGASEIGSAGERAANLWGVAPSGGVRSSAGVGIGVFYDLLHIDLARGLDRAGRTRFIVEFQRAFWDLL